MNTLNIEDFEKERLLSIECGCGSKNTWSTTYFGAGLSCPNVKCKDCGKEWVESPDTKLNFNQLNKTNE